MVNFSTEARVGAFVLGSVALLAFMSLRLGGFQFGADAGYNLTVKLESAAGLDREASVRIAGVEVGRVREITLEDSRARLTLRMNPGVEVGRDFSAVLKTKGLLGEKYLELIPGEAGAMPIAAGGEITHVRTYADMDKLITQLSEVAADIKKVSESMSEALGTDEGKQSLKNIVRNVEEVTAGVNTIIARNDEKLNRIMTNLDEFTTNLKGETPKITASLREVADNLNKVITENREDFRAGIVNLRLASAKLEETLDTINTVASDVGPKIGETASNISKVVKKIDEGQGTLGKLVNDPTVHERFDETLAGINRFITKSESFRTYLAYRAEYLVEAGETKSYFSFKIRPKADKYYLLEIIDDPRGKIETETREVVVGGVTTTTEETTTSDEIKFSAQVAKRFESLTIRGGLIESSGGFGLDYNTARDRLIFSLDVFDFDSVRNPHMKVGFTYHINKYFYLTGGYDDFISKVGLEDTYIGLGFQFEDDDIKYIFSSLPVSDF